MKIRFQSVAIVLLLVILTPLCFHAQDAAVHPFAPNFSLKDVNNHAVSLADYKGKVVVVSFWKTSCILCQKETANLISLQDKYRSLGLTVVGISTDETPAIARDSSG